MITKNIDVVSEFNLPMVNGVDILFRPVMPEDRQTIIEGMLELSKQSRYFRFFSPISSLPDSLLEYLTHIDQNNHVAWIAVSQKKVDHNGVGISRFIRLPDEPEIAEIAMVVLDRFQKTGVGTYLMALLYHSALIKGIKILRAFVLAENKIMSDWLGQLGALGKFENGVYKMDLKVHGDFSLLPATSAGKKLREALEKIDLLDVVENITQNNFKD